MIDRYSTQIDRLAELCDQAAHIELLRGQAELALIFAMKQDADTGGLTDDACADVYVATRDTATKGFWARWDTALPRTNTVRRAAIQAAHRARKRSRAVPNGPDGRSYVGTTKTAHPAPMPAPGTCVVYVLSTGPVFLSMLAARRHFRSAFRFIGTTSLSRPGLRTFV